ncbi:hypothetical protein FQN57_005336 [Myotisia sp. PD_48]|nr:hypothetical protein FQN57_005336 [Myotisia sp. PD_48]
MKWFSIIPMLLVASVMGAPAAETKLEKRHNCPGRIRPGAPVECGWMNMGRLGTRCMCWTTGRQGGFGPAPHNDCCASKRRVCLVLGIAPTRVGKVKMHCFRSFAYRYVQLQALKSPYDQGQRDAEPDLQMPTCHGVDIEEFSIPQLQQCLTEGKFSGRELTACYLERIDRLNGALKAVIENIATKDKMETTAGSSMLVGAKVPEDAHVISLLRDAGAILLGHANMSERAAMRSSYYSGSAVAVAANMCAFSLGTETDGSVMFPADRNGVVGIKPTVGLTSCKGVIPQSSNLDTVGTFGRTVIDAAIALDGIRDIQPSSLESPSRNSYASYVSGKEALKGAKFGLPWKRHHLAPISGSIDPEDDNPLATAWRELAEETTLTKSSLSLWRQGKPYTFSDLSIGREWTIHPFGFKLKNCSEGGEMEEITIDWEHEEWGWFGPDTVIDDDNLAEYLDYSRACKQSGTKARRMNKEGAYHLNYPSIQ